MGDCLYLLYNLNSVSPPTINDAIYPFLTSIMASKPRINLKLSAKHPDTDATSQVNQRQGAVK